ncbi:hypothetical protein MTE1_5056 [Klebsiella pneumoniae JHCK1]|nr:hypothetical protein MTE1_5056 [Klebsiella pneumoniae JHCK1]
MKPDKWYASYPLEKFRGEIVVRVTERHLLICRSPGNPCSGHPDGEHPHVVKILRAAEGSVSDERGHVGFIERLLRQHFSEWLMKRFWQIVNMEPSGGQRFVVYLRFELLRHVGAVGQVVTMYAVRRQRAIVLIACFLQHLAPCGVYG